MPFSLDGLSASLDFMGYSLTITYSVREGNFGPKTVSINGNPVRFTEEENKYRKGGAVIPLDLFSSMLNQQENTLEIGI